MEKDVSKNKLGSAVNLESESETSPEKAVEQLKEALRNLLSEVRFEAEDPTTKLKISFSISKLSQHLIKQSAERFSVNQGHIVDLAPYFFEVLAEKSLKRRERAVPTLKLLQGQIQSSVAAMSNIAPHLGNIFSDALELIEKAVSAEDQAIKNKNYAGIEMEETFLGEPFDSWNVGPPFNKEFNDFFKEKDGLAQIFTKLYLA